MHDDAAPLLQLQDCAIDTGGKCAAGQLVMRDGRARDVKGQQER